MLLNKDITLEVLKSIDTLGRVMSHIACKIYQRLYQP